MPGALLHCPIRGTLTVPERAADELTFTEEKRRIDCINLLLSKGYPPDHIRIETTLWRFGSHGRNSFRTDLAVLDVPVDSLPNDLDTLSAHITLVAEIKRDSAAAVEAIRTQVYPALNFLPSLKALGIYWDDVQQRLFYRALQDGALAVHEAPIATLPSWGQAFAQRNLKAKDLRSTNLKDLFERIENRLHVEVSSKARRFELMHQLLVLKLYDEYTHPEASDQEMALQDFAASPLGDAEVASTFNQLLKTALGFYQPYLPRVLPRTFECSGSTLREISSLLAPVLILGSKREVIQDFYMYFASEVYKWDLGQYFTPTEVVDFIVEVTNPKAGEHVKDPACGSGDFLISAFQYAERTTGANLTDSVWGADNSAEAVQVAVLNMVLNGDGKSQIEEEDSLLLRPEHDASFGVLLCNPPFGVRITETRSEVLQHFDLGHDWRVAEGGRLQPSPMVLKSQEVGLLFTELCVRQTVPGGRVGIILPNGYLGNRSKKYRVFREWLIRHARVVGVVAFPRFTFKRSGADVSASAVFLEKRRQPLSVATDGDTHPFYAGVVESVGWSVSDKKAKQIFKREAESGVYVTDSANEHVVDADFSRILSDMRSQRLVSAFPWLANPGSGVADVGWSVDFREVLERSDLSLDPKRYSERYRRVRSSVLEVEHFNLGQVVDVVSEEGAPDSPSQMFSYIELQDAVEGIVTPKRLRGWQLPDRARHRARHGDLFVGGIWGSVSKWFVCGEGHEDTIVSNGFKRLRLKQGFEDHLPDIVASLASETYLVQARALCTGSDGLAELSDDAVGEIVLPKVTDPAARSAIRQLVDGLLARRATVGDLVGELEEQGLVHPSPTDTRGSNWVQV
ncbi:MAG: N-6 DNA methylase [Chloroflexi bacterium]|nr:N-6 DNA methylase [Chloroflexota bacterium]